MDEATILAGNALVSSHLKYCNFLFRYLSIFNKCKLQCVQNALGRIATNCSRYSWATTSLAPVEFCCIFKTATLVNMFLCSGHSSYFNHL